MLAFFLLSQIASYQCPVGYFKNPVLVEDKVVVTDNACSAIYLIQGKKIEQIFSRQGCGRYYQISPDGQKLGIKIIGEEGLQSPALLDLDSKAITYLCQPAASCGQVSFADNGAIAFTVGEELLVRCQGRIERYPLGNYANLAPISPDANYVCYNDGDDQLWLLNLKTQGKICLTDRWCGYFDPIWSPDSKKIAYSTLGGIIKVYDLVSQNVHMIGSGKEPSWSDDSYYLVYHVEETNGHELTGSDLYRSSFDGLELVKLTETSDVFEMEPRFTGKDEIVYHNYLGQELFKSKIGEKKITDIEKLYTQPEPLEIEYRPVVTPSAPFDSLDIPYIHQVYDTPDWFNGNWACAPTTALMAIIYYRRLPHWDCQCSTPYPHTSHWGRYICERYHYREVDYNWQAQDPGGTWARGGYGYMWNGSNSPYSTMVQYYLNHNINSWRDDSPTLSEAVAEFNAGYPYSMCVGLTTAGHLVLGIGYAGSGIIISNDPYGNKNRPGYPNYYGKYSRYDWPGYNNGYQNLNSVYWTTTTRGNWPTSTDTIVDDLAIEDGFYLHTDPPATMAYWWDQLAGYGNHLWWTYTTVNQDTCYATWTPRLVRSGNHEVFAYIPGTNATAMQARYVIYYNGGNRTVTVDQSANPNQWVSLGTFSFNTTGGYVKLGDAAGTQGQRIAFDAVKWIYKGNQVTENCEWLGTEQVGFGPNVVRENLSLSLNLTGARRIEISIFDRTGGCVQVLRQAYARGEHRIEIKTNRLSSGVYFLSLRSGSSSLFKKFIVIR